MPIPPNTIMLTSPNAQNDGDATRMTSPFRRSIWTPTWIKHLASTGTTEQPPWYIVRIWLQVPNKMVDDQYVA